MDNSIVIKKIEKRSIFDYGRGKCTFEWICKLPRDIHDGLVVNTLALQNCNDCRFDLRPKIDETSQDMDQRDFMFDLKK